ncbi:MAG: ATP-binding cassette domain-containing protein [Bacteroidales bacterium]|nr:ATP-binding cassette domain-containing protein [Bacteroidales bacterium]
MWNWKPWIVGIKGPNGVGKSTLLKQHIRETAAVFTGRVSYDSAPWRAAQTGVVEHR